MRVGGGDRSIPGTCWPASLAESVNSIFSKSLSQVRWEETEVTNPVSKSRAGRLEWRGKQMRGRVEKRERHTCYEFRRGWRQKPGITTWNLEVGQGCGMRWAGEARIGGHGGQEGPGLEGVVGRRGF